MRRLVPAVALVVAAGCSSPPAEPPAALDGPAREACDQLATTVEPDLTRMSQVEASASLQRVYTTAMKSETDGFTEQVQFLLQAVINDDRERIRTLSAELRATCGLPFSTR